MSMYHVIHLILPTDILDLSSNFRSFLLLLFLLFAFLLYVTFSEPFWQPNVASLESSNCAQMASRFLELFAFQQFLKSEKFIPGRILLAYLMVVLMYELNQEKNYKSQFTFTSLYEVNMRVRTRIIIGINSV